MAQLGEWTKDSRESKIDDFVLRGSALKKYTGKESRVVIPASVRQIEQTAVAYNAAIEELIIPETVEIIHGAAIYSCKSLKHLVIEGTPRLSSPDHFFFGDCPCLKTAGPLGSGMDVEYGWTEGIPEGAFWRMEKILLPAALKYLPEKAVRYCEETVFVCPGETFALLPTKYKSAPALRWLSGEEELDETQQKPVIAFIKRTKDKCFAALLERRSAAGIARLLSVTEPPLEKLDAWIAQSGDGKHVEELAALLAYKASVFSSEQLEKNALEQQEKDLGVREKTLSDWRQIYRLGEVPGGYSILKYKLDEEELVIPETIGKKKVVSLGKGAFSDKQRLRSVFVPDSVQEADADVFSACGNLKEIRLPNRMKALGEGMFSGCKTLASIRLPEGIREIPARCLAGCGSLREVDIPESVSSIGERAFILCAALEKIGFPAALVSVGSEAFRDCARAEIPALPASVTRIGERAFAGCAGFSDKTVLNRGEEIHELAFLNCPKLADENGFVVIRQTLLRYCGDAEAVTVPAGIRKLGWCVFEGCRHLKELKLPEELEEIDSYSFRDCAALEELVIPAAVRRIGTYAFSGCGRLREVKFVKGSVRISDSAFFALDPSGITFIAPEKSAAYSFARTSGMTAKALPAEKPEPLQSAEALPKKAAAPKAPASNWVLRKTDAADGTLWWIDAYKGKESDLVIPAEVKGKAICGLSGSAFQGNTTLRKVLISEGIRTICDNAFRACSALEEIRFPESLVDVGNNFSMNGYPSGETPFHGTPWQEKQGDLILAGPVLVRYLGNAESLELPEGIRVIGELAFMKNKSLKKLVLPQSLKAIRRCAFEGCGALQELLLPEGLEEIENGAFAGCRSLTEVTLPKSLKLFEGDFGGGHVFSGCSKMKRLILQECEARFSARQFFDCSFEIRYPQTEVPEEPLPELARAAVGDVVRFGRYPKPLEWIVLEKQQDRALLLAKDCIESAWYQLFSSVRNPVTWEKCRIRAWLNGPFRAMAFSDAEKKRLSTTLNHTPDNAKTGAAGGKDTKDELFLLSEPEVKKYFPKADGRKGTATAYARSSDEIGFWEKGVHWWLRTPCDSGAAGVIVRDNGSLVQKPSVIQSCMTHPVAYIRPACWVVF